MGKGQQFERDLSRDIGRWWCDDPNAFWRTSGSGARSKKAGIHFLDIAAIKMGLHEAPICIEAKNRKAWSFTPIVEDHKTSAALWSYWDKAVLETCPGCLTLLIFKGLRTRIWVAMGIDDERRLEGLGGARFHLCTRIYPSQRQVVLLKLTDFCTAVKREHVLESYGIAHPDFPKYLRPMPPFPGAA